MRGPWPTWAAAPRGKKILTRNNSFVCFNNKEIPKIILYRTEGNFGKSRMNAVIFLFPSKTYSSVKSFICPTNAHTNYSKIVELLKTFKTATIAPTCFGLHKPSSGSSQSVLRQSYNIDFSVYMSLMKFSVLWLHSLFRPVVCVYRV